MMRFGGTIALVFFAALPASAVEPANFSCDRGELYPLLVGVCVNGISLAPAQLHLIAAAERATVSVAQFAVASRGDFYGGVQTGLLVFGDRIVALGQAGAMVGVGRLGVVLLRTGAVALDRGQVIALGSLLSGRQHHHVAHIAAYSIFAKSERELALIALSLARGDAGSFFGGLQVSGFSRARFFAGIAQIGLYARAGKLFGLQLAVVNRATALRGIQLGLVNLADHARGVQVGLVNRAEHVVGVQLGLVNISASQSPSFLPLVALRW